MKTFEQRLAKVAEMEEHYFKLWERHYNNSIHAWARYKKAQKKAERIVKKIQAEQEAQARGES